jgi:hypothetical protein
MGAPKENQFWKLRSKHGRDRLFDSPELLWEAATEYFEWCDEHPYLKQEQKKGNVIVPKGERLTPEEFKETVKPIVELPTERPYTMQGLCLYLNCGINYFNQFEESLKGKNDSRSKDFSLTITRIRETIQDQQVGGGLIGAYNPMLTARILGLTDKQDITSNGDSIALNVNVSNSGLSKDLNKE